MGREGEGPAGAPPSFPPQPWGCSWELPPSPVQTSAPSLQGGSPLPKKKGVPPGAGWQQGRVPPPHGSAPKKEQMGGGGEGFFGVREAGHPPPQHHSLYRGQDPHGPRPKRPAPSSCAPPSPPAPSCAGGGQALSVGAAGGVCSPPAPARSPTRCWRPPPGAGRGRGCSAGAARGPPGWFPAAASSCAAPRPWR